MRGRRRYSASLFKLGAFLRGFDSSSTLQLLDDCVVACFYLDLAGHLKVPLEITEYYIRNSACEPQPVEET